MSQTTTLTPPRHALVQVTDDRGRVGSLHAALLVPLLDLAAGPIRETPVSLVWRTACGVDYLPGRVKALQVWEREAAFEVLDAQPNRHCARCTRVGDAVDTPEAP